MGQANPYQGSRIIDVTARRGERGRVPGEPGGFPRFQGAGRSESASESGSGGGPSGFFSEEEERKGSCRLTGRALRLVEFLGVSALGPAECLRVDDDDDE